MCDGRACRPFLFLLRSIGLAEHRLGRWHQHWKKTFTDESGQSREDWK
jgi:hypothetical protein